MDLDDLFELAAMVELGPWEDWQSWRRNRDVERSDSH